MHYICYDIYMLYTVIITVKLFAYWKVNIKCRRLTFKNKLCSLLNSPHEQLSPTYEMYAAPNLFEKVKFLIDKFFVYTLPTLHKNAIIFNIFSTYFLCSRLYFLPTKTKNKIILIDFDR